MNLNRGKLVKNLRGGRWKEGITSLSRDVDPRVLALDRVKCLTLYKILPPLGNRGLKKVVQMEVA